MCLIFKYYLRNNYVEIKQVSNYKKIKLKSASFLTLNHNLLLPVTNSSIALKTRFLATLKLKTNKFLSSVNVLN